MIELGDFDGLDLSDKEKAFDQASEIVTARALMTKRKGPEKFMVPDPTAPGGYRNALSGEKTKEGEKHE